MDIKQPQRTRGSNRYVSKPYPQAVTIASDRLFPPLLSCGVAGSRLCGDKVTDRMGLDSLNE